MLTNFMKILSFSKVKVILNDVSNDAVLPNSIQIESFPDALLYSIINHLQILHCTNP